MKHSRKNLVYHELIGLRVRVVEHIDPSLVGVSGIVVDETQKTLLVETKEGRRKRILKEYGVYEFRLPSGEKAIIRGFEILGRPEDRLKQIEKTRR